MKYDKLFLLKTLICFNIVIDKKKTIVGLISIEMLYFTIVLLWITSLYHYKERLTTVFDNYIWVVEIRNSLFLDFHNFIDLLITPYRATGV